MKTSRIWQSYEAIIYKNCTDENETEFGLSYWRNRLFAIMVIYLLPLSLIAIIPGMYLAIIENLTWLVIADTIAILSLISIAFLPGLTIYTRKLIFCSSFYLVSIALLFYLGTFGPGLMYLLAITIMVVLILDAGYAFGTVALNTLVCIFIGLAIYLQWFDGTLFWQYTLQSWFAVSSNLVFLSLLSVLLIPKLFNGLQATIGEQNKLKNKLEENQKKLKTSLKLIKEKNKELEDFAYVASHDLKEPLRMIRSFIELLDKNYSKNLDEKAQKYIRFAADGARRMTAQIDDLLEYSRIGRVYTDIEKVDVNEIVNEIIHFYSSEPEGDQPVFKVHSLPVIDAVPVSIKMIFQNLISNSLKYQSENSVPVIEIDSEDSGDYWQFSVADNGIGIEEEHYDQIFQLFKRLHSTTSYSGSGMGLAICKKIVEQHKGKIWVKSKRGEGSTFYFTIRKGNKDEINE